MSTLVVPQAPSVLEGLTERGLITERAPEVPAGRETLVVSGPLVTRLRIKPVPGGSLLLEVEGELPLWLVPSVRSLCELLWLEPNWDSFGALPVERRAVEQALAILFGTMQKTTPPPIAVPTSSGGIQLEWHLGGIDLEVELEPDGTVGVYFADKQSGTEWERSLASDYSALHQAILRLTQGQEINQTRLKP